MSEEDPGETSPKTFVVFWGDTREVLSREDRRNILQTAVLEHLSSDEVLLRDPASRRLVVVRSAAEDKGLFCDLCRTSMTKHRYGKTCPDFANCVYRDEHKKKLKKKATD